MQRGGQELGHVPKPSAAGTRDRLDRLAPGHRNSPGPWRRRSCRSSRRSPRSSPSAWAAWSASIAARIAWAGMRPLAPAGPDRAHRRAERRRPGVLPHQHCCRAARLCRRADLLDAGLGQQYRQVGLCRGQLPDLAEQHQVKHPHGVAVHQSPQLRCQLPGEIHLACRERNRKGLRKWLADGVACAASSAPPSPALPVTSTRRQGGRR